MAFTLLPFLSTLFTCFLLYCASVSLAQGNPYFQQQVDYQLTARLRPVTSSVSVTGQLVYHNNSPEALDSIPIHLWANAYRRRESPFSRQMLRDGKTEFAFAPAGALGGIDSLVFTSASVSAVVAHNPELHTLQLTEPLPPGGSFALSFSYALRVPLTFSRMGRGEQTYQLTQWYPKPAVYDRGGWHPIPYLDQGEFYSEFGDYQVSIEVPTNGIVAATGELVNDVGVALREERIRQTQTDTVAVDSLSYRPGNDTFTYVAKDVHDFAWFAAPHFRIRVDSAALRQNTIPAYSYYDKREARRWRNSANYLARAAVFADSAVGPYPYPQISAVRAPLGAGGGMEYPMITVIGPTGSDRELDEVLAHEAFHNWFYGLLASDERTHPWMDEGLTSYFEGRYMDRYYAGYSRIAEIVPGMFVGGSNYRASSGLHRFLALAKRAPAPDTHGDSLTTVQYGSAAYLQPQGLFELLDANLPAGEFGERLSAYYDTWALRHPGPDDLRESLGGSGVDWLFDNFLLDTQIPDYRISSVTRTERQLQVTVVNDGGVASPFPLAIQVGGDSTPVRNEWIAGFTGARTIVFDSVDAARLTVAIDPELRTPELARGDNYYRLGSVLPKANRPVVNFLSHVGHPDRTDVNLLPLLSFNSTEGVMLGVGAHNHLLLGQKLRFEALPFVSTRSGSVNGLAGLSYSFYEENAWWRELELSARGRAFGYNLNETYDYRDRFQRLTLGAELLLKAKPGLPLDNRVYARTHVINQNYAVGVEAATRRFTEEQLRYAVYEFGYSLTKNSALRPTQLNVDLQAAKDLGRISATYDVGFRYRAEPSFVRIRAFAGAFVARDDPAFRAVLLPNGVSGFLSQQYDYTFEEPLINRSGNPDKFGNQHFVRDGSLTLPFLLPVPFSDSWLASVSAVADAPLPIPFVKLQAYFDVAGYPDERTASVSSTVLPYTGGLRLSALGSSVELSFPLVNSPLVREALPFQSVDAKYWDRVALRVSLDNARFEDLLRRLRG